MGKDGLDATEKSELSHTYTLFGHGNIAKSGIFITFSGNCKEALTLYHNCFGGELYFDTFQEELAGYTEKPVIMGTMVSESIVIYVLTWYRKKEGRSGIISRSFCHVKMQRIGMC